MSHKNQKGMQNTIWPKPIRQNMETKANKYKKYIQSYALHTTILACYKLMISTGRKQHQKA